MLTILIISIDHAIHYILYSYSIHRYIQRCWSLPGWLASSPSARWTAPPRSRPAQLRSLDFFRACLKLSGYVLVCLGGCPTQLSFVHFAICTYLSAVFHNKSILSNMKETEQGNLLGLVWLVIVWARNRASTRSKPPWSSSWPNVGWRGRTAKRLRTPSTNSHPLKTSLICSPINSPLMEEANSQYRAPRIALFNLFPPPLVPAPPVPPRPSITFCPRFWSQLLNIFFPDR